jgi:hypothetical protein
MAMLWIRVTAAKCRCRSCIVGAAAGAAARPEGLGEAVPGRAPHHGEVRSVVVGVGDNGARVLPPEPAEARQEAPVVRVALTVDGGGAAHGVAVISARQHHGQRQAPRQRQHVSREVARVPTLASCAAEGTTKDGDGGAAQIGRGSWDTI